MRTRLIVTTLLIGLLSAGFLPSTTGAQTTPAPTTSSIIVKAVAGTTADAQAAIVARNGGTITSAIPALRLLVVSVPSEDLAAALARYQADPQVQSVEENKVRVSESVPSDLLYVNQWALAKIGWDQVFGVVTPTGSAKVALLDTGVDAAHPELADKVLPGTSILDGSNGMTDPSGHGTWLAGIIAAQTNTIPGDGIAGVAYAGVKILPVTVLNANGEGQDSDVIAGVIWAADQGADVILMAFSNPGFSQNLQDAIDYAWSKGAVIVASSGNNALSAPHFPAGDRGVMGVAATDQSDALASFSNSGQAVFIAAPGVDIQTIDVNGNYIVLSGTSTAAAHVAGFAGFMKAVNPALPNGVIVGRIARNADPAGTQEETGNGRINIPRALVDTSLEFIQPAGAAPVGEGGPFVGPYRADAVSEAAITARNTTGPTTCGATDQTTFPSGTNICARAAFQISGSAGTTEQVRIQWVKGGVLQQESSIESFSTPGGTPPSFVKTDFRTITTATNETWQLRLCSGPSTGSPCTGGAQRAITTFTVTGNVTITFDASNITDLAATTQVLTVTIGATVTNVLKSDVPKSFPVAPGTSVSYSYNSPLATGVTGKQYRWGSTAGTGSAAGATTQSGSVNATAAGTVTAAYVSQFQLTFTQSGIGGDSTGTVVTVDSNAKTAAQLPFSAFFDSGASVPYSYNDPVASSTSGKRYALTTPAPSPASPITVSGAATITGTYKAQFQLTFAQSGIGADSTGTVVTVNGSAKTATDLPFTTDWIDGAAVVTYLYNDPVPSTVTGKRYALTTPAPSPASPITVSGAATITGTYKSQFQLTFTQSGIGADSTGTVVTVNGSAKTAADLPFTTDWIDSGASVTYSYNDPVASTVAGKRYALTTPAASPASPITVSGPATITGTYKVQFELTFAQSGIAGDSTGTVVTVDGSAKTAAQLPFSGFFDTGATVTYSYNDPVASTVAGKRYVLTTPAPSPASPITVAGAATITGTYKAQFQLTFTQSGIGGDSTGTVVTVNGSAKTAAQLPFSAFFDSGVTVTYSYYDPVASTVAGKRYVLTTPAPSPASPIIVAGGATITGTYKTQFQLTFTQSGIGADSTGTVVTVDGGAKTAAQLPFSAFFDSGSTVAYSYTDPVASTVAGKRYALTTPPPSPASPITVAGSATITGTYKVQFQLTFTQSGIGADSTGTVVTVDGGAKTAAQLPFSAFFDSGSTVAYSYTDPVASTVTGKRYALTTPPPSPASPIAVAGATTITGTYKTQYLLTFGQSGITGGTGGNTIVTVDAVAQALAALPFQKWYDSGATATFSYTSPVFTSPVTSTLFLLTGVTGATSPVTVNGPATIVGTYAPSVFTIQYLTPIDQTTDGSIRNEGKNGRVIPVKVRLYQDNVQLNPTTVLGDVTIRVSGVTCGGTSVTADVIETYADAGSSNGNTNLFRWASDGWIYNLDTGALRLTTNSCYRLDVFVGSGIQASYSTFAVFKPVK